MLSLNGATLGCVFIGKFLLGLITCTLMQGGQTDKLDKDVVLHKHLSCPDMSLHVIGYSKDINFVWSQDLFVTSIGGTEPSRNTYNNSKHILELKE